MGLDWTSKSVICDNDHYLTVTLAGECLQWSEWLLNPPKVLLASQALSAAAMVGNGRTLLVIIIIYIVFSCLSTTYTQLS